MNDYYYSFRPVLHTDLVNNVSQEFVLKQNDNRRDTFFGYATEQIALRPDAPEFVPAALRSYSNSEHVLTQNSSISTEDSFNQSDQSLEKNKFDLNKVVDAPAFSPRSTTNNQDFFVKPNSKFTTDGNSHEEKLLPRNLSGTNRTDNKVDKTNNEYQGNNKVRRNINYENVTYEKHKIDHPYPYGGIENPDVQVRYNQPGQIQELTKTRTDNDTNHKHYVENKTKNDFVYDGRYTDNEFSNVDTSLRTGFVQENMDKNSSNCFNCRSNDKQQFQHAYMKSLEIHKYNIKHLDTSGDSIEKERPISRFKDRYNENRQNPKFPTSKTDQADSVKKGKENKKNNKMYRDQYQSEIYRINCGNSLDTFEESIDSERQWAEHTYDKNEKELVASRICKNFEDVKQENVDRTYVNDLNYTSSKKGDAAGIKTTQLVRQYVKTSDNSQVQSNEDSRKSTKPDTRFSYNKNQTLQNYGHDKYENVERKHRDDFKYGFNKKHFKKTDSLGQYKYSDNYEVDSGIDKHKSNENTKTRKSLEFRQDGNALDTSEESIKSERPWTGHTSNKNEMMSNKIGRSFEADKHESVDRINTNVNYRSGKKIDATYLKTTQSPGQYVQNSDNSEVQSNEDSNKSSRPHTSSSYSKNQTSGGDEYGKIENVKKKFIDGLNDRLNKKHLKKGYSLGQYKYSDNYEVDNYLDKNRFNENSKTKKSLEFRHSFRDNREAPLKQYNKKIDHSEVQSDLEKNESSENRKTRKSLDSRHSFKEDRNYKTDVLFTGKNNEKLRDLKQERGYQRTEKPYSGELSIVQLFDKAYADEDNEYKVFLEELRNIKTQDYPNIEEVHQDLFQMSDDYCLAHCVAEDLRMGSGIAVKFRDTFGLLYELFSQHKKTGDLAYIRQSGRYVFYLITKRKSNDKPTYKDFFCSLKALRDTVKQLGIRKLAVPTLGCGLDRLDWPTVKHLISFLFKDFPIEIVVCKFRPTEELTSNDHLVSINYIKDDLLNATDSVIVYFTDAGSHISEEMKKLDTKYRFLEDFKKAPKKFGGCVVSKRFDRTLCGLVVREKMNAQFSFRSLSLCLSEVKKYFNRSFALQCITDESDNMLGSKIVTCLLFEFKNTNVSVNIYKGNLDISFEDS